MRFRALDVAAATGGRLVGPDVEIDGASFDTRSLRAGQLFVPVVAARDGHEFVPAALAAGAAAYLTSLEPIHGGTAIVVPDTLRALMDLAADRRRRCAAQVVGITGSVGKTSTKDLAAAALGAVTRVWANARSFNNDQGLPTTVLEAPDDTSVMVLEMGMRGFGEIARLAALARPDVGVVTRVAEAHGERVGGIEGVARAKAELVQALPASGVAVLNADDERVRAMGRATAARVVLYGEGPGSDVRITRVELDALARPRAALATPWGSVEVAVGVSGRHMAANAAAALAVVGVLGFDVGAAAGALSGAVLSPNRMALSRLASGAMLLDDSYNANPTSMRAALDALAALPAARRVAIVGLMAEVADAPAEHLAVRRYAEALGVELITVGTDLYGVAPVDDPLAALGSLAGDDAVLVKASRAAALDRVAGALVQREGGVLVGEGGDVAT